MAPSPEVPGAMEGLRAQRRTIRHASLLEITTKVRGINHVREAALEIGLPRQTPAGLRPEAVRLGQMSITLLEHSDYQSVR